MIFEISFELWVLIFLLGNQMGNLQKMANAIPAMLNDVNISINIHEYLEYIYMYI